MMGIIAPELLKSGKPITKRCTAMSAVELDSTGTLATAEAVVTSRRKLMVLKLVTRYLALTTDDDVHLLEAVATAAVAVTTENIP